MRPHLPESRSLLRGPRGLVATRSPVAVAVAVAVAAFSWSPLAGAQSNPGFYPARYVVCHDEKDTPPPPPSTPVVATGLLPVPRRKAPPVLSIAPLEVADVAVVAPIPARAPLPSAAPPEKVVLIEGDNDFHCIGFARGRAGILRVVTAPAGARFAHHQNGQDWRLVNYRAAGAIGLKEAIPALRREIERPVPPGPADYHTFDVLDAKLHAMRALGDLEDRESAARVVAYLRTREDESYSLLWEASLAPLQRLDPAAAQAYAMSVIRRIAAGKRAPKDEDAARDDSLIRSVLPLLTTRSATDLAVLQALDTPAATEPWRRTCRMMAARVTLGDDALKKELRAELATDLRTNRAATCYSELMVVAFPGEDPDEVDTLLFRQRYPEILNLLERSRSLARQGKLDAKEAARWKQAESKLLAALRKRSGEPSIAAGKSDTRFRPGDRTRHLVALSVLGDAAAKADLDKLIDDPKEDGVWPFLAAEEALRFDLPGAADHAAIRLRLAIDHHTSRYDTDLDPVRGFLSINDHVRVIDALAARGDARFALGLLDEERWGREAAAVHLARLKPAAACDLVGSAAHLAAEHGSNDEHVQDAFWALSLLGDACRATAWKLLHDTAQPAAVTGMSLELLAMLRDPRVSSLLESKEKRDPIGPYRRRARIIYLAKE